MYFGHATGLAQDQSRGSDDPDGDGVTNLQEALAGTDPHNPNSFLRITEIRKVYNDIWIFFPQVINKRYQLQRTTSLTNPSWANVGIAQTANATNTTFIVDSGGATLGSPQFYRITVLQ
jgi:hypothetical protein